MIQRVYKTWCVIVCPSTDNGVSVDLSSERGSGPLHRRVTQLPRDLVVHLSGFHHRYHRTGTDLHTQALLHRQARSRPAGAFRQPDQRHLIQRRTASYASLEAPNRTSVARTTEHSQPATPDRTKKHQKYDRNVYASQIFHYTVLVSGLVLLAIIVSSGAYQWRF